MSFDDFVRVGNVGTNIIVTMTRIQSGSEVAYDVSSASSTQIVVQKPNGRELAPVTATFVGDGTDGVIEWKDTTGIFDTAGRWKVRGQATFPSGDFFKGSWFGFAVDE